MKKSTKIIIIVAVVVVVLAAVGLSLYFFTDIFDTFKKPKALFYEYLGKATESSQDVSYEQALQQLKKSQEQSFKGTGKVSIKAESSDRDLEDILKVVNGMELSFDVKSNPKDGKSYSKMAVKYDNKELVNLEMLANKDSISLKVPEMLDKYITIENRDLKALARKFGIDASDIPNKIESLDIDLYELLYISDKDIDSIKERYKKVLQDATEDEQYEKTTKKIKVNGESVEATAYTLALTQKDALKIAEEVLKSLKDDDTTLDILLNKYDQIMKVAEQMDSSSSMPSLSKSQLKSGIEYMIESLKDVKTTSDEKLEITVYEYKGEAVRVEVAVDDTSIFVNIAKEKETTTYDFVVRNADEEMTVMTMAITKKGDKSYETKLSSEIEGVKLSYTVSTEEKDSKMDMKMQAAVEVQSIAKIEINAEETIEYTDVDIESVSSSNSYVLNDMTTEEITQMLTNALVKGAQHLDKNMDVVKSILTTLDMEDEADELEQLIDQIVSAGATTGTGTPATDPVAEPAA